MERDNQFLTALLIEAKNKCGRATTDLKEVCHFGLLRDLGYAKVQLTYDASGVPTEARITRITNKGFSALAKMNANGEPEVRVHNAIEVKLIEPVTIRKDDIAKLKDNLQEGKSKERSKLETILYSIASAIIVLSLNIGSFCYQNNISLCKFRYLLVSAIVASGISIISLYASDIVAVKSREAGIDGLDGEDEDAVRKMKTWNKWTKRLNTTATIAFAAAVALSFIAIIVIVMLLPNLKTNN